MKKKLEVEINNIIVDDDYYSFDYVIRSGKEILAEGEYNSDYENGNTPEKQVKLLKEEAWKTALEQLY